jgi:hypothetical protein
MTKYILSFIFALLCVQHVNAEVSPIQGGSSSGSGFTTVAVGSVTIAGSSTLGAASGAFGVCVGTAAISISGSAPVTISAYISMGDASTQNGYIGFLEDGATVTPWTSAIAGGLAGSTNQGHSFNVTIRAPAAGQHKYCLVFYSDVNDVTTPAASRGALTVSQIQ